MKADVINIGGVFSDGGNVHYVLPRFQRAYAWGTQQWHTLWNDVMEVRRSANDATEHFLGAIVVIEEETRGVHIPTYTLVDGQQRLVTLSVFLHAMAEQTDDDELRDEIDEYLTNRRRKADLRYTVLPTEHRGDREAWTALVDREVLPAGNESGIPEAYEYFRREIRHAVDQRVTTPHELFTTLTTRLNIVFINLQREERPHQIFESLNTKGMVLSEPDKVRNYLAMRLPQSVQGDVWDRRWRPIEKLLDERKGELSSFLLDYLARATRVVFREDQTYQQFRKRMDRDFPEESEFNAELSSMYRHAKIYNRLLRPKCEPDDDLRLRFIRINALRRTVVYPLLLSFYDLYQRQHLTHSELCEALDLVENYLVRHYLANEPTGALRRYLARLVRVDNLAALKQELFVRNYPPDARIRESLKWARNSVSGDNRRRLIAILIRVNQQLLKGSDVDILLKDEPTIEHIMPRTLNRSWERNLGQDWADIHNEMLNTIGNLTLVTQSWNSSLSNSPWQRKCEQLGKHGLPLNNRYFGSGKPGDLKHWDRKAINARQDWLVDHLLNLWPGRRDVRRQVNDRYDPDRHPQPEFEYTNTGVISLTIRDETWNIPRRSWNYLIALFTNRVAVPRPDFEEIVGYLPEELSSERRHNWDKQLENGWFLCYMWANYAARYLIELAALCDLDDQDWHITLRE